MKTTKRLPQKNGRLPLKKMEDDLKKMDDYLKRKRKDDLKKNEIRPQAQFKKINLSRL